MECIDRIYFELYMEGLEARIGATKVEVNSFGASTVSLWRQQIECRHWQIYISNGNAD